MCCNESKNVVKDTDLLGDLKTSVLEPSDVRSRGAGEIKELGMGCERSVGKTRGERDEVLVASGGGSTKGSAGFLANCPAVGSLKYLLIEGVAVGNQGQRDQGLRIEKQNPKSASLGQPDEAR